MMALVGLVRILCKLAARLHGQGKLFFCSKLGPTATRPLLLAICAIPLTLILVKQNCKSESTAVNEDSGPQSRFATLYAARH